MGSMQKNYQDYSDIELLNIAVQRAGEAAGQPKAGDVFLANHLGRSYKTVIAWKSKGQIPQGIREHLLLILEFVLDKPSQAPRAMSTGGR